MEIFGMCSLAASAVSGAPFLLHSVNFHTMHLPKNRMNIQYFSTYCGKREDDDY